MSLNACAENITADGILQGNRADDAAFSSDEFICDSSLHVGEIVEHTTSWLTINPVLGCPLACAYCFRARWHPSAQPTLNVSPKKAVADLIGHSEFVAGKTPLAINVSSTDALLPQAKAATFECLRLLDTARLTNIVGLITKCRASDDDVVFLRSLRHLRLIVFVSYAEIPQYIEPVPIEPRLETLRRIRAAGLPGVLYFRPIVVGWNDSEQQMERVLGVGSRLAGSIVYGGLHLSPEIRAALDARGVSYSVTAERGFHEKPLDSDTEARLLRTAARMGLDIPLYKHTSCAIAHAFGVPNYNNLQRYPQKHCSVCCPKGQQSNCMASLNRNT